MAKFKERASKSATVQAHVPSIRSPRKPPHRARKLEDQIPSGGTRRAAFLIEAELYEEAVFRLRLTLERAVRHLCQLFEIDHGWRRSVYAAFDALRRWRVISEKTAKYAKCLYRKTSGVVHGRPATREQCDTWICELNSVLAIFREESASALTEIHDE